MNPLLSQKERPGGDGAPICNETQRRRTALKKWFQHALLRESDEEEVEDDDLISIDENYDLMLVPSFGKMMQQDNEDYFESPTAVDSRRFKQRRQKLRELKFQLKQRLHHLKHENQKLSNGSQKNFPVNSLLEERATLTRGLDNPPIDVEDIHLSQSTQKDITKKEEIASDGSSSQKIGRSGVEIFHTSVGTLDPTYLDVVAASTSGNITRIKRQKEESGDDVMTKRTCSDRENSCTSSAGSSGIITSNTDQSSIEKTPSAYLTKASSKEDEGTDFHDPECSSLVQKFKPFADHSNGGFPDMDSRSGVNSSGDSLISNNNFSADEEISSEDVSCGASGTCARFYTIPTFRRRHNSLNVANIVRSFKDGTLNEQQLTQLAHNSTVGESNLTFKNKEFYDELPNGISANSARRNDGEEQPKETSGQFELFTADEAKNKSQHEGGVKFDRYSYLIVYKSSKRRGYSLDNGATSLRDNSNGTEKQICRYRASRHPQEDNRTRSILKKKSNLKEKEETQRAIHCDRVDIDSFMNLFEHFENKRQVEECKLSKVREKQLNHYYSERFFPELMKDMKQSTVNNTEFFRSRKATELNIGRKLGDIKCNVVHYICGSCDSEVKRNDIGTQRQE